MFATHSRPPNHVALLQHLFTVSVVNAIHGHLAASFAQVDGAKDGLAIPNCSLVDQAHYGSLWVFLAYKRLCQAHEPEHSLVLHSALVWQKNPYLNRRYPRSRCRN